MSRVDRAVEKFERDARQSGYLPRGEHLLAATSAALDTFTDEDGRKTDFGRRFHANIGVSETRLFVINPKHFRTGIALELLTHATAQFGHLSLQWLTPHGRASCLEAQIDLVGLKQFFEVLKTVREQRWLSMPRADQVALCYHSGAQPGASWRNEPGVTLEDALNGFAPFIEGRVNIDANPNTCGLVNSVVDPKTGAAVTTAEFWPR
jgi:hypothetical protein